MSIAKIYIDPSSRVSYASYYIEGLYNIFGKKNVIFRSKFFKNLVRSERLFSFNHYFAFVHFQDDVVTRFVIDFCDPTDISDEAYFWCDVYAKINVDKNSALTFSKMVVIPPSFGVKIWDAKSTLRHVVRNFISCKFRIPISNILFFKDYWTQFKRLPLSEYQIPLKIEQNYVFMAGTFWQPSDVAINTNNFRIQFIYNCLRLKNITFEGGLFAKKTHPKFKEFFEVIFSKKYSLSEYVVNTKKSCMVFNTPAVHDCHGWKLVEFLALGKTILSTPLSNELPKPLRHGIDIHIVDSIEDLAAEILYLQKNADYSKNIAAGAKKYFDQYATPNEVIKSIFDKSKIIY